MGQARQLNRSADMAGSPAGQPRWGARPVRLSAKREQRLVRMAWDWSALRTLADRMSALQPKRAGLSGPTCGHKNAQL
jgi:hypothetical protein